MRNPHHQGLSVCAISNSAIMGIYLSSPVTDKASDDGEITDQNLIRFGLSSMQGWRTSMEDAHAAIPNLDTSTSFFAVYDGHGGKCVAKFCAKYLHREFLQNEAYRTGDLCTAIKIAFLRMDQLLSDQSYQSELLEIEDKTEKGVLCDSIGSTACVAIIRENNLIVANAGDSRCVISREGKAHDLSTDHKPELEGEEQRILKSGGYIQTGRVNGVLNLARAIGDMEFKRRKELPPEEQIITANPDVKMWKLCDEYEFLVVACDGIWECLSSQEVVDFICDQLKCEKKLSVICERVVEKCLSPSAGGEGSDNMTIILVQLQPNST